MHTELSRRTFVKTVAASGTASLLAPGLRATPALGGTQDLNVALIGAGAQGRTLLNACLDIPGIRFRAVCDIWSYSQGYAQRYLKRYGHEVQVYEDFEEMLSEQTDLDAVLIASPDCWHAPQSIACLRAGLHVYCEKVMANHLDAAADMVRAARESGNLLQIGHQRRSNPRYLHARDKLIHEAALLGRLTHANAHWHRAKQGSAGWPQRYAIDEAILHKYGYANMHQFRNWRWYKAHGGGPLADLGAHQLDVLNWFFDGTPRAVLASGGLDFHDGYEWNDNVMAILEYDTKAGHRARAQYQVITTNSAFGFQERFLGTNGAMVISETPRWNRLHRESNAPDWEPFVDQGLLKPQALQGQEKEAGTVVDARETLPPEVWEMNCELNKPIHQPHLENFFDGIRKQTPLHCPAEVGFATAVTVKKVDEAIRRAQRLELAPNAFLPGG